MKNKYLISVPYIYPVCPLSIDHAKIMLVADINARAARANGKEVCFPIAAHYSGVTAEKTIENLKSANIEIRNKERDKFIKIYKTPRNIVENFNDPTFILDYYTVQTIMDLKRLNVSCDYENFYKTNDTDYENFVHSIFEYYDEDGMLVDNKMGELSLNYDHEEWRKNVQNNLQELKFIHPNQKNNIISSLEFIKSDWGILRNYGIGVRFKNYIIDPMFDSELFVLFDLYKKFYKKYKNINSKELFKELIKILKSNNTQSSNCELINEIVSWLPTDLFVCEEHLKTWIIKKTFAETLLFNKKFHTKNYFITGMGYIDNKRMSASRGTAVLLKDLLDEYGTNVTRAIIMFTGGHPSKMYNYTPKNAETIKKMIADFYNHINYINSQIIDTSVRDLGFCSEFDRLSKLLTEGYYQQLLVEVLTNLPKKCYNTDQIQIIKIKNTIDYFVNILLPDIKF